MYYYIFNSLSRILIKYTEFLLWKSRKRIVVSSPWRKSATIIMRSRVAAAMRCIPYVCCATVHDRACFPPFDWFPTQPLPCSTPHSYSKILALHTIIPCVYIINFYQCRTASASRRVGSQRTVISPVFLLILNHERNNKNSRKM